ncbi:hypothetical protein HanHA300_Chr05g0187091 [Helianthus annuus]|nr:hypothetical protein HanHA300_Chr05g0187091 [Helianthus annuus]KAJ0748204.1 hypothetical protein HanOQP8_Chr05g0198641 [Helianthus annuus]
MTANVSPTALSDLAREQWVLDPSDGDPENPQPGTLRPLSATQKPLMGVGPSCTSLGKGAL